MELEQICQGAKAASQKLATLGTNEKNRALTAVASALVAASADIIAANKEDLENGKKKPYAGRTVRPPDAKQSKNRPDR